MESLTAIPRAWDRFWFPPVPTERVAIFRLIVTGFALIDVTVFSRYVLRYSENDLAFFHPVVLLRVPELLGLNVHPIPPPAVHAVLYGVMIAALLASFIGYRTRLALAVAAPLFLYHWAIFNSWGKVNHGKIPVIIALLVLIVAPAAGRYSVDALRRRGRAHPDDPVVLDPLGGWALRVVGFIVVAAYMLSVLAKLANSGPTWAFQPVLARSLLTVDSPLASLMLEQPTLLVAAQIATLVAEALAVLAFAGGWRRNVVLATLASMHIGSYLLLRTEFFGFIVCYAVFYNLEEIPRWFRYERGRRSAKHLRV